MATNRESSKQTSRIVLIVVGVLVLSALAYFTTKYFSEKQQSEVYLSEIKNLNAEVLELEEKILNFEVALEDKNLDLSEKDKLLEEKYMELEAVVGRLAQAKQNSKADQAKIRRLENKVQELQNFVDQYRAEIEYLQAENQALTGQVDSLNSQANVLQQENRTLKASNIQTQMELDQTRQIAEVLRASSFDFYNVKKNGKEEKSEEFRRNRLKNFKVCFTILENPLARKGPRELFMVYENPEGTINTNFNGGFSGSFTHNGKNKDYTAKVRINFDGISQEVCIPYTPEDDKKWEKGQQYVSVYTDDGILIGQGNFEIK